MKKFLTIFTVITILMTTDEIFADNLKFVPVTPCRAVDTRIASRWGYAPMVSDQTRDIRLWGDLSSQGGAAGGCVSSNAASAVINMVAVPSSGCGGVLTSWAYGQSRPLASTLNYSACIDQNARANGVIMPMTPNTADAISVWNNWGTTHIVIDVMGYFYSENPSIRILQPIERSFQTSNNIYVLTNVFTIEDLYAIDSNGAGVKFILDGGLSNGGREYEDSEAPFEATFSDVIKKEHTIRAVLIDDSGMEINGPTTEFQVTSVGVGDYYVAFGDSITFGYGDDISLDDVSLDLRNRGRGYEPILNDLLTAAKGYPHTILNEGVGGEESIDGAARIQSVIAAHQDAQYFLILFGTNDSSGSMPTPSGVGPGIPASGTFEYNMQQIINAIDPVRTGKIPILAKVPIRFGDLPGSIPYPDPENHPKNLLIEEYNAVIDELKSLNPMIKVMTGPPQQSNNFFTYFRDLPRVDGIPIEFFDNLHPNGVGYQSMADLWFETLTE